MGWSIGFDERRQRDIGYGVPSVCDLPGCGKEIDRGLAYVCGSDPYGGEYGCGLYFCEDHLRYAGERRENKRLCPRCLQGNRWGFYTATPDTREWTEHKLTDESWQQWRDENSVEVARLRATLEGQPMPDGHEAKPAA